MILKIFAILSMVISFTLIGFLTFRVFKYHHHKIQILYRAVMIVSPVIWLSLILEVARTENLPPLKSTFIILFQICVWILFIKTIRIIKAHSFTRIFSLDTPQFLVTMGPYSVIRHPAYTSYLVSYGSPTLLLAEPIPMALFLIIAVIYISGARMEESKFLQSDLREEYLEYQTTTGMFFPICLSARRRG